MVFYKQFDNGLRLVVNKLEGFLSVSCGVIVNTGSCNEEKENNGISHFIEHTVFKGTKKRTAFEISDYIDSIGAQINAFTSKELTCYYTKSTLDHAEESMEVLSDIFFDATFDENELEKEKGVILEEISMSEDSPEDLCLELLSESCFGKNGLGQPILGNVKNIKSFTKEDIKKYMSKYYTADNVVISLAGNVDMDIAEPIVKKLFADKFEVFKCQNKITNNVFLFDGLNRVKKIEQSHIAFALKGIPADDNRTDSFNLSNAILGGGMSSRLFQKIREEMGLCYSVYSYLSQYKDCGLIEIYAGVNTEKRDKAVVEIKNEVMRFKDCGITEKEFLRGKEQLKSAFIMSKESTSSQMLLYGKYLVMFNKIFDLNEKIKSIEDLTLYEVNKVIKDNFDISKCAMSTVGPLKSKIK